MEEKGGKKNYFKMKQTNNNKKKAHPTPELSTEVLSCFIWGAVKTTKIQSEVKVVSPEINTIKASVISIAGELSSSKHI